MPESAHPSRAAIAATQLEQLRSLIAELFPANRFYTRKLQAEGVTFDVASLADFSARFPFTAKPELVEDQLQQAPFGTNLTYPFERYTRFHQTSGTTGTPLRWLDTSESWDWMLDSWTEVLRAAAVTAADNIYFAFSFGPFIGFWLAFESAARMGCLCLPGGGLGSAARLRDILDLGATVLCCTPTYAIRLGEVAAGENLDLKSAQVKTIIVAGEPGGSIPATRARIEQLWPGARVFDHHGMTEVGPVTHECPMRPGVLHVIESAYLAEVIDPGSGRPVAEGGTGELVLTTLGRTGSPLLRYRTGDLVKPASRPSTLDPRPCPCGRYDVAFEGGILGRTDDMVIVRGVNVYPTAIEQIIHDCGGVAEYRVCVSGARSLAELSVQIEPVAGRDAAALIHTLQTALERALTLRVPVTAIAPGTLLRFEMKSRRWIRE